MNENISYETTENAQLGGIDVAPKVQPPPRMYFHPPPWMSYTPPYMIKDSDIGFNSKVETTAIVPASTSRKKVEKKEE